MEQVLQQLTTLTEQLAQQQQQVAQQSNQKPQKSKQKPHEVHLKKENRGAKTLRKNKDFTAYVSQVKCFMMIYCYLKRKDKNLLKYSCLYQICIHFILTSNQISR